MEDMLKDILNKSMTDHGWPDRALSDDEMFSLEFGDIAVAPKPAIRQSITAMDVALAEALSARVVKALS